MDVFQLRELLVSDYADYVRSFVRIRNARLGEFVTRCMDEEALWPQPLVQLNPSFAVGGTVNDLVNDEALHRECGKIFRIKSEEDTSGIEMRLYQHQVEAIRAAVNRDNYVLTTGTGSGKSLAYIIPIVDHVLRHGSGQGIQAIIVYPMNALCNSQFGELEKFLKLGYGENEQPVTFARYTGQDSHEDRARIIQNPPDILLTNYVMLELLLTRPHDRQIINRARDLKFLVLDELHTYRGRQGADVALLVRRVREACEARDMLCVGTSATMATEGTFQQQQAKVAEVATTLFGDDVHPDQIIGETLTRTTNDVDFTEQSTREQVRQNATGNPPADYDEFVSSPLASWLEETFGLHRATEEDRLVRAHPQPVTGETSATTRLAELTGLDAEQCETAIRRWLLASYECTSHPITNQKPFAFRLHQFISRGDVVYATLEDDPERQFSLVGQQFAPGSDRTKRWFPVSFCRTCGAESYTVWKSSVEDGPLHFRPRDLFNRFDSDDDGEAGFLYRDPERPWPDDLDEVAERLPEDWTTEANGRVKIKSNRRDDVPVPFEVAPDGQSGSPGTTFWFTPVPFRFCQCCGVEHRARKGDSDFGRQATLGSGGRSTATTILGLSSVRFLQKEQTLQDFARKLLSFTDNRQDASLQAGHFNDFVEVGLLRAGLFKALDASGDQGISHDELAQKVFGGLSLDFEQYAREPGAQFAQRQNTDRAMRLMLGYRLYRDLKRGWRITSPNLEQCGLLRIEYQSLDELCAADDYWQQAHPALVQASPATRERIATVLLDFMRRDLAIDVDYLTEETQERLKIQSSQYLRDPWAIDENERTELSTVLFPRGRRPHDRRYYSFVSGRSGFGQFLGRSGVLPEFAANGEPLKLDDKQAIIGDLLQILTSAQFVSRVIEPTDADDVPGYQLTSSVMLWKAGDGTAAAHDEIRVPQAPEEGFRPNEFFVRFYREVAIEYQGIHSREHTAQVPYEEREQREASFGDATLPVLFCSPTMELGVDIRQLNVVNMRNVPPTPANYAQRSGRAGRSGQPALVFTYCTTGNSHDQYFFRRPHQMVSGSVTPPRLDLANEELVRAHVNSIWLAETGCHLGQSLPEILDVEGESPTLRILPSIHDDLTRESAIRTARTKASAVIKTLTNPLEESTWYTERWLDDVLNQTLLAFEQACERWRSLFQAAKDQFRKQNSIIEDVSKQSEWNRAKQLRREAEAQIGLLTDTRRVMQSDFYSYRYFASEGFLPGYNFPRLPLSAFIPARRSRRDREEFLARPRFIAITEFGPQSIVYHEGSRYVVNRVILPVPEGDETLTQSIKLCRDCGYVHPLVADQAGPDCCHHCKSPALWLHNSLLRMQNVSTRRRDRISSDEEERQRQGYEILTGVRFHEDGGISTAWNGEVSVGDRVLLRLTYGSATNVWRINLGWSRRANREQVGFLLDVEKGNWERNEQLPADGGPDDPLGHTVQRVIPFVEDRCNSLIIETTDELDVSESASLQSALKQAIQIKYQLEDRELAAEPLPSIDDRRQILLFESAEGGAGVLQRIMTDPDSIKEVARLALEICHFDAGSGEDMQHPDGATEDCVAACYDCLMSYTNQRDHSLLDRHNIRDLLLDLSQATVQATEAPRSYSDQLEWLRSSCDSRLEEQWLDYLAQRNLRLPTDAQVYIEACQTKPDFVYKGDHTVIYIDGPPHDYPERQDRDAAASGRLADIGMLAIRFHHADDWAEIIANHPNIFGVPQPIQTGFTRDDRPVDSTDGSWWELADESLHEFLQKLESRGVERPEIGFDLVDHSGVVGQSELAWPSHQVAIVLPSQAEQADAFTASGWRVVTVAELDDFDGP